jgi:hypothetical protein
MVAGQRPRRLSQLGDGQVLLVCGRCTSSGGRGDAPLAVIEPDRRVRYVIDWQAEDLSELARREEAEPYLEVWLVDRRGRSAVARTGTAATSGFIRTPASEARRRLVTRTELRLAPRRPFYEFRCRHCHARPRVAAATLRQAARGALSRRPAKLVLWPDGSFESKDRDA